MTSFRNHLSTLVVFSLTALVFMAFSSRFSISINRAASNCLNVSVVLVDEWETKAREGNLMAFEMPADHPLSDGQTLWLKQAVAGPGSTVTVHPDKVIVNSVDGSTTTYKRSMQPVIEYFKLDVTTLVASYTMQENEWFMLGETPSSYDSRFWGPVKSNAFRGQGFGLF